MNSLEQAINAINKYNKKNLKNLEYNDNYHDYFQAPNIKLNYRRVYKDIIKKRLLNKILVEKCREAGEPDNCYEISKMFENIKFDMDNKGAKVENEAVMTSVMFTTTSLPKPDNFKERYFYLNKDYWIIMKRADKKIPYFALGVRNGNLMKKNSIIRLFR